MESSTAAPPNIEDARKQREAEAAAGHGADLPGEEQPTGEGAEGGETGEEEQEPAFPKPELLGEGQLTLNVGGEKPTLSQIKMGGASIDVPNNGEFKKGQMIDVVVRCRVAEVTIGDKFDNTTGTVTDVYRRHFLKPLKVERVD